MVYVYMRLQVRGHTRWEIDHLGATYAFILYAVDKNEYNNTNKQRIVTVVYQAPKHGPGTVLNVFMYHMILLIILQGILLI